MGVRAEQIENRLAEVRRTRGIAASELARRLNVSRQTIYAIESGAYVPNTVLALHRARELEVGIQDLFSLPRPATSGPEFVDADVLGVSPPLQGQPVRMCQVDERWVGVPVTATPYFMPDADGLIGRPKR